MYRSANLKTRNSNSRSGVLGCSIDSLTIFFCCVHGHLYKKKSSNRWGSFFSFVCMYVFYVNLPKKWFWWIWSGCWIGGKFKFQIWSFWLFVFKLEFFFQQFLERFEFWHNRCIIQTRFWLIFEGRARKKENYLRFSI